MDTKHITRRTAMTLSELNIKIKLAALWTSLMMLYIYADIFSLYRPGVLDHINEGMMGPIQANQTNLAVAALLMAIPALMIALSVLLNSKASKRINIVLSILYVFVGIGNLIGETWIYYIFYGGLEIAINILIITMAVRWKPDIGK